MNDIVVAFFSVAFPGGFVDDDDDDGRLLLRRWWWWWMGEGGVELCFYHQEEKGEGERGSGRTRKRVITETRGDVDVDASGAPPCKAGVVSKWQMVRLR